MIENLRKYTGLSIAIFAVAIVAFVLGDYNRGASSGSLGGQDYMRIGDRTYTDKDVQVLGARSLELVQGLGFENYDFLVGLSSSGKGLSEDPVEKFFTGRMILRQAKETYGIHPGPEEIAQAIRKMGAFSSGPDPKFDPEKYDNFNKNIIGRLGLTEKDLQDLVSDIIAYKKLNAIIGGGLLSSRESVSSGLALQNQKITGEVAKMDLAPFQDKIQPTEDEIKAHWDTIAGTLKTEPRRKFSYVIVTPQLPAEPKIEDEKPNIANETLSEEAKKEAAKKKEEERTKRLAEHAEQSRKKQMETDGLVDVFVSELAEQNAAGFEELAKANGWEVKTTELFTATAAPAELSVPLRSSTRGGNVAGELFKIQETKDPSSKISPAIAIGQNQWLIARLDAEEKSRDKTFEEARNEVRAEYIAKKATENLKTAANEAVTKIKTLTSSGKSFADAAKEAGISQTKAFTDITSAYQPDPTNEPRELFRLASTQDPSSISEPTVESDRAFIIRVTKREVTKEPNADTRIDAGVTASANQNQYIAFQSWLKSQIDAAKVERLIKQTNQ